MKRFKLTIIFAFVASVIFTSCDKDFETINIDPNNPTSLPAHLLLPSAVRQFQNTNYSTFVGGDFADPRPVESNFPWRKQFGRRH